MVDVAEKQVIKCPDLSHLPNVAKQILSASGNSKILLFKGDLGAGKTTLIKEICHQLQIEDVVSSPTFSIINEYGSQKGNIVYHFDFYRINSLKEAEDLGLGEYFFSGELCMIEWPDKVEELLPERFTEITIISNNDNSRIFEIRNNG